MTQQKINLLWDSNEILSGYSNIDQFGYDNPKKIVNSVTNLSNLFDRGEINDIISQDVLDHLYVDEVAPVLNHWVSLLEIGGRIIIGGTDAYSVAQAFAKYKINLTDFNRLLHGTQEKPSQIKYTNYTMLGMVDVLQNMGLKIISKKMYGYDPNDVEHLRNFHYYVEAIRQ